MQLPHDQLHEVIAMLAYQSMKAQEAAAQNHMAAQSLGQQLQDEKDAHEQTKTRLGAMNDAYTGQVSEAGATIAAMRAELAIANETLKTWAQLRAAAQASDATPANPTGNENEVEGLITNEDSRPS